MASYEVNVSVDPGILKVLGEGNYKLCMAKAVGNAGVEPIYNVVATVEDVSANVQLKWVDKYQMYGTKQVYMVGSVVTSKGSEVKDIKFKERYNLPRWDTSSVTSDPSAPDNGFVFNNGVTATPVVALKPSNHNFTNPSDVAPIYIGPTPDVPGKDILIPLPQVALWFQKDIKASTMVSLDKSRACLLDLTEQKKQSVTYDGEGAWGIQLLISYINQAPVALTV